MGGNPKSKEKQTSEKKARVRAKEKQEGSKPLTKPQTKGRRHNTGKQLGGVTGKGYSGSGEGTVDKGKRESEGEAASGEPQRRTKQGAQPEGRNTGAQKEQRRDREDNRGARNRERTAVRRRNDLIKKQDGSGCDNRRSPQRTDKRTVEARMRQERRRDCGRKTRKNPTKRPTLANEGGKRRRGQNNGRMVEQWNTRRR